MSLSSIHCVSLFSDIYHVHIWEEIFSDLFSVGLFGSLYDDDLRSTSFENNFETISN